MLEYINSAFLYDGLPKSLFVAFALLAEEFGLELRETVELMTWTIHLVSRYFMKYSIRFLDTLFFLFQQAVPHVLLFACLAYISRP